MNLNSFSDCCDVQLAVKITQSSGKLVDLPFLANHDPPTSMKILSTVQLPSHVRSVTKYQNLNYAGLENSRLMRVTEPVNTSSPSEFVKNVGGGVSSAHVYNNEL